MNKHLFCVLSIIHFSYSVFDIINLLRIYFLIQTALMFTWSWFAHFAMSNDDIDEWKWSGDGITCSGVKCYNRQDNIAMFAAKENLLKNDPVLTFVQLGK